ncbi:MAG TPA: hypothetical protein VJ305_20750 [Streptosporangiaceae bacterium]|nr:hypothetical protein [Streptosporangiaceae bacterium]
MASAEARMAASWNCVVLDHVVAGSPAGWRSRRAQVRMAANWTAAVGSFQDARVRSASGFPPSARAFTAAVTGPRA